MTARVFVFPRISIDLLIGTLIHDTDAQPNLYLWLWRFHGVSQQSLTLGYDNGAIYKSHFFAPRYHKLLSTPWQVRRPGGKLGGFERHLLTRVSCHFAVFTPDGWSAVNKGQRCSQPITDRLGLTVIQFGA